MLKANKEQGIRNFVASKTANIEGKIREYQILVAKSHKKQTANSQNRE